MSWAASKCTSFEGGSSENGIKVFEKHVIQRKVNEVTEELRKVNGKKTVALMLKAGKARQRTGRFVVTQKITFKKFRASMMVRTWHLRNYR